MFVSSYGDFVHGDQADESWSYQMQRYQKCWQYFSGRIFEKRAGDAPDSPLLFPLRINLVRMMCLAQAGALFGQWDDDVVVFRCQPRDESPEERERADMVRQSVVESMEYSCFSSKILEVGLDMQVYGGGYLRVAVDPWAPHGVRVDKLMPYQVFPRHSPIDMNEILEAYIAIPVDRHEASLAYNIPEDKFREDVVYVEHWTTTSYRVTVGDFVLASGENPWGFVPIVYIPRIRSDGFYGIPLSEDIMGLQDELNARLADIGDRINDNAHPIRCVRNYRGNPQKDLQIGPDVIWNLGMSMPGTDPPDVFVLAAQPEPVSSFQYMGYMLNLVRNSAFTSAVAFGEDEGSQRSGVTLELRLWPMLQMAKMSRAYLTNGLTRLANFMLTMMEERDITGRYKGFREYAVVPNFAPLIPRDMRLWIEEFMARAQYNMISPEEAIAGFGVRNGSEGEEIERIRRWNSYLQTLRDGGGGGGPARGEHGGDMPA